MVVIAFHFTRAAAKNISLNIAPHNQDVLVLAQR